MAANTSLKFDYDSDNVEWSGAKSPYCFINFEIFGEVRLKGIEPIDLSDDGRHVLCIPSDGNFTIRTASPHCLKQENYELIGETTFNDDRPLEVFKHSLWYEG